MKNKFLRVTGLFIVSGAVLITVLRIIEHKKFLDSMAWAVDHEFERDLTIRYPLNDTIFPPDIIPPVFIWQDQQGQSDRWAIAIDVAGAPHDIYSFSDTTTWSPAPALWDRIKRESTEKPAVITILGFQRQAPLKILSKGRTSILTSNDKVDAPIFYRSVNLPFIDAVKDPSLIQWRMGDISSPQEPPVVLEHLPVCGNCHSFSADAKLLAMDVDYANDKGSYIITQVAAHMHLPTSDIITWEDFDKGNSSNQPLFQREINTFGLLSQISPDGQYVISTVRDRSVFVDKPDLAFSQLFFPVKGILAIYTRQSRTFTALAGADKPEFVQSNANWSPDGQRIVFARSQVYRFRNKSVRGKVLLTPKE